MFNLKFSKFTHTFTAKARDFDADDCKTGHVPPTPTCWFDVALPQIQHKREGTQGPQNYVIKDQNKEEVLASHVN